MKGQFQQVVPMTLIVKRLIIINVAIWVGLLLILQKIIGSPVFFEWLGFIPIRFFQDFWVWQPFTYMFLHSDNVIHLLFNMLLLWWLGAELEMHWGRRFFLFYYLACGIGSALLYMAVVLGYYLITANVTPLMAPVVGASGAIFGLILAYGIIFGDRVIYFLMIFPMKARHFVMIIGAVELVNLLSQGFSSQVANLAHLGGLVTGFLILKTGPRIRDFFVRRKTRAHGRKLKLVVDNENSGPAKGPRYWN